MYSQNEKSEKENIMKYLALLFTFVSGLAFAGPYVSIINDLDMDKLDFDSIPGSFDETTNDVRLGYSGKFGYVEYGQYGSGFDFDTGDSAEAGFKTSIGGFELESKIEGKNIDEWYWQVETEVKYNLW